VAKAAEHQTTVDQQKNGHKTCASRIFLQAVDAGTFAVCPTPLHPAHPAYTAGKCTKCKVTFPAHKVTHPHRKVTHAAQEKSRFSAKIALSRPKVTPFPLWTV
jgi:hypothetical protein